MADEADQHAYERCKIVNARTGGVEDGGGGAKERTRDAQAREVLLSVSHTLWLWALICALKPDILL